MIGTLTAIQSDAESMTSEINNSLGRCAIVSQGIEADVGKSKIGEVNLDPPSLQ